MSNTTKGAVLPLALLIGLQCIDVMIHVATGQVEPIRIAASGIVAVAGIAAVYALRAPTMLLLASGLVYVAFNGLFLLQSGLINPETESVRIPLFGFVIGTLAFLTWLARRSSSA